MIKKNYKITIIGLGYVGLPLAIEFAKKYPTIGYDININRINELNNGIDNTLEVKSKILKSVLVNNFDELKKSNGFFLRQSRITMVLQLAYTFHYKINAKKVNIA